MNFICIPCKEGADGTIEVKTYKIGTLTIRKGGHADCRGGTWCDCQHRSRKA